MRKLDQTSVFSLVLASMTPSTVASPAILDLFCTDEEVFLAIRKISSGCPLPQNVYGGDIDPYRIKPSNLPGNHDVFLVTKIHVSNFSIFLTKFGVGNSE